MDLPTPDQVLENLTKDESADLIIKNLARLNLEQLSRLNVALQPLLQRDFITMFVQRGLGHISEKILSYLDAKSLAAAEEVCHEWRSIINDKLLWKKLIEKKVQTDRVWAGIVKRRGWSSELFRPTRPGNQISYKHLYYNIVNDIKDLEIRWRDGKCTPYIIHCQSENSKGVYCIQYDDDKIVSGLRDNTIKIWDRKNYECKKTFEGHIGSVLCLQYDQDIIVSGSSDSSVRIWDLKDDSKTQPINTIQLHTEAVLHLKFSKKMMVTCSKDRTIIVWRLINPKEVKLEQILVGHRAAVNVVDFDDKYIVSASGDRTIKVWNATSFEFIKTLSGHKRGIACLQYRDGRIVSGSSDNCIRIWDIESGACLRVLDAHKQLVRCIRFDQNYIVSGDYDGKIKIWNLRAALDERIPENLVCMRTLEEHNGRIFRVQFDDFQIVSSSHDDTIIIWDFLRETAPGRATNKPNDAEQLEF